MRFVGYALVATALLAPAFSATAGAHDQVAEVRAFDMEVRGSITERCSLGSLPTIDLGDLSRPGNGTGTKVDLTCNFPYNLTTRAQNGRLAHTDLPAGQGGYAGSVPYTVGLVLPVRRPQSTVIARSFEGDDLRGNGASISSEGGIAVDGLALSLSLGQPSGEAGLLAGRYGETIEIAIAPS